MTVRARFPDTIYARGRVALEPLANYVRQRVDAKRVDTGPVKTVFVQATLKADPKRQVRVEVSSKGGIAQLMVRDQTRPPAEKGLSPEERWRRSGVTPDRAVLAVQGEFQTCCGQIGFLNHIPQSLLHDTHDFVRVAPPPV